MPHPWKHSSSGCSWLRDTSSGGRWLCSVLGGWNTENRPSHSQPSPSHAVPLGSTGTAQSPWIRPRPATPASSPVCHNDSLAALLDNRSAPPTLAGQHAQGPSHGHPPSMALPPALMAPGNATSSCIFQHPKHRKQQHNTARHHRGFPPRQCPHTTTSTTHAFPCSKSLQNPQNPGISTVGRDLCRSPSPIP